jgi:hypothetical protein
VVLITGKQFIVVGQCQIKQTARGEFYLFILIATGLYQLSNTHHVTFTSLCSSTHAVS